MNYKKKLQKRLMYITVVFLLAIFTEVIIFMQYRQMKEMVSFFTGFLSSIGMLTIFAYIQYFKMMRNPIKLKEEQIKEEDERNQWIEQKVNSQSFIVLMSALAGICILFAFMDLKSTILIGGLLWLGILVKFLLYMYYRRKL